jgi:hypothetical protein
LAEGLQQGERQPQLQSRELKDFRRFCQTHSPADQHDDDVHHDQHAEDESDVEEYPRRPGDAAVLQLGPCGLHVCTSSGDHALPVKHHAHV